MKYVYYLCMGGILLMGGMIVFNLFQTFRPIEVGHNYYDRNPLIETVLRPGDLIQWKVNYDHYTDGVYVDVTRELWCGQDFYGFTPAPYTTEKGHVEFTNKTLIVPLRATPASSCSVHTTAYFHISPERTIVQTTQTEEFSIIK